MKYNVIFGYKARLDMLGGKNMKKLMRVQNCRSVYVRGALILCTDSIFIHVPFKGDAVVI